MVERAKEAATEAPVCQVMAEGWMGSEAPLEVPAVRAAAEAVRVPWAA